MLECYVYDFLILMRAEAWLAGFELYAAVLGAPLEFLATAVATRCVIHIQTLPLELFRWNQSGLRAARRGKGMLKHLWKTLILAFRFRGVRVARFYPFNAQSSPLDAKSTLIMQSD
jgi:hypothetical protein